MITLGGVELHEQMVWADEFAWTGTATSTERTIDGSVAMHSTGLQGGRPITLQAVEGVAWLTRAQLEAVQAFAEVPGATYTLDMDGTTHRVVITGLQASELWLNAGKFFATISMVTR